MAASLAVGKSSAGLLVSTGRVGEIITGYGVRFALFGMTTGGNTLTWFD